MGHYSLSLLRFGCDSQRLVAVKAVAVLAPVRKTNQFSSHLNYVKRNYPDSKNVSKADFLVVYAHRSLWSRIKLIFTWSMQYRCPLGVVASDNMIPEKRKSFFRLSPDFRFRSLTLNSVLPIVTTSPLSTPMSYQHSRTRSSGYYPTVSHDKNPPSSRFSLSSTPSSWRDRAECGGGFIEIDGRDGYTPKYTVLHALVYTADRRSAMKGMKPMESKINQVLFCLYSPSRVP